jgi:hypothetical protein
MLSKRTVCLRKELVQIFFIPSIFSPMSKKFSGKNVTPSWVVVKKEATAGGLKQGDQIGRIFAFCAIG